MLQTLPWAPTQAKSTSKKEWGRKGFWKLANCGVLLRLDMGLLAGARFILFYHLFENIIKN